jgi:hypothetical protein
MKRLSGVFAMVLAAGLFACATARADYVMLYNGKVIFGQIKQTADSVYVHLEEGVLIIPLWRLKEVKVAGLVSQIKTERSAGVEAPEAGKAESTQEKPVEKPKLTQADKRNVYIVLVRAERLARDQAERQFPVTSLKPGYGREELDALISKRGDAQMRLVEETRQEVMAKHNLSEQELSDLFQQAQAENWPTS